MANKRQFKKDVAGIGAALCNEMMINACIIDGVDKEKVNEAVMTVLNAMGNAIKNANVFFDKGRKAFASETEYKKAKREFFKTLFAKIDDDVNEGINAALKLYNEAQPESAKAENKKLAAAE